MLRDAWAGGLAAARAGGWRAYLLALAGYVPAAAADLSGVPPLVIVAAAVQTVVVFALIRLLGARRPQPVPAPPQVDAEGRRVQPPLKPGPPLGPEDARPRGALRNAFALWVPAVRYTLLMLLALVGALFTSVAVTGGRLVEASETTLNAVALPISALFLAFLAVAPQRIALEGDPRVLVAVAHSVRIARTAYGLLLALTVAEPLVAFLASLPVPDKDAPAGLAVGMVSVAVIVSAAVQVVTTAVATEVFLRGPRLELPVDPRAG